MGPFKLNASQDNQDEPAHTRHEVAEAGSVRGATAERGHRAGRAPPTLEEFPRS